MTVVASRSRPRAMEIEPPRGLAPYDLHDIWRHRDLFLFLVRRDVKVRWAQTRIGSAWLVFQPLAMLAVYTFAFSSVVDTSVGVPYPVYALAGLTIWQFVSRGVSTGAESLVIHLAVIKQTACPRILFPLATVCAALVDFAVALGLYLVLAGIYSRAPTWHLLAVFPLLALALMLTLGLSLLLAPLDVRYRDVERLLPFVVLLWFFLSPVAYRLPSGTVSRAVSLVNPMVGILGGFRWALIGSGAEPRRLLVAALVSIVAFVAGLVSFARSQQTVADDL